MILLKSVSNLLLFFLIISVGACTSFNEILDYEKVALNFKNIDPTDGIDEKEAITAMRYDFYIKTPKMGKIAYFDTPPEDIGNAWKFKIYKVHDDEYDGFYIKIPKTEIQYIVVSDGRGGRK